ncbi:YigZ family protein [Flavobacteriales bacterium]|jgi:uncharacterized YigZ family protein|nr:YigZ family protein [Flavobacteriales bacterium]
MNSNYKTISEVKEGIYKEKGSKFLAYISPVTSVKEALDKVEFYKEDQPSARHHCYAYRIGSEGKKFRSYDDGEPTGTAGKPILNQLLSNEITNVIVVVVRYFGGTKLGTSGLITAYKEATIDAINKSEIIESFISNYYELNFTYDEMPLVMKWSKQQKVNFDSQVFDLRCCFSFKIPISESDHKIDSLPRGAKAIFLFQL